MNILKEFIKLTYIKILTASYLRGWEPGISLLGPVHWCSAAGIISQELFSSCWEVSKLVFDLSNGWDASPVWIWCPKPGEPLFLNPCWKPGEPVLLSETQQGQEGKVNPAVEGKAMVPLCHTLLKSELLPEGAAHVLGRSSISIKEGQFFNWGSLIRWYWHFKYSATCG